MKLFFDECVPKALMRETLEHETTHGTQIPYRSTKNGALLRMVESEFDVFITTDKNLSYQQDLSKYNLAFVILDAVSNDKNDLLPLMPKVIEVLTNIKAGDVEKIG